MIASPNGRMIRGTNLINKHVIVCRIAGERLVGRVVGIIGATYTVAFRNGERISVFGSQLRKL